MTWASTSDKYSCRDLAARLLVTEGRLCRTLLLDGVRRVAGRMQCLSPKTLHCCSTCKTGEHKHSWHSGRNRTAFERQVAEIPRYSTHFVLLKYLVYSWQSFMLPARFDLDAGSYYCIDEWPILQTLRARTPDVTVVLGSIMIQPVVADRWQMVVVQASSARRRHRQQVALIMFSSVPSDRIQSPKPNPGPKPSKFPLWGRASRIQVSGAAGGRKRAAP